MKGRRAPAWLAFAYALASPLGCGGTTEATQHDPTEDDGGATTMVPPGDDDDDDDDDDLELDGASSGGADTTGSACVPSPGGYDECEGFALFCPDGGVCLSDMSEFAVCTYGCFADCSCPDAPAGSDATPVCRDDVFDVGSACVLDCGDGAQCPAGMDCTAQGFCAFDFPAGATAGSSGGDTDGGGSSSGDDTSTSGGDATSTGGSSSDGSSSDGSSSGGSSSGGSTAGASTSSGGSTGTASSGGSDTAG